MRDHDLPKDMQFDAILARDELVEGFDTLTREKRLFGAELNPEVLKKSGSGKKFLITKVPQKRKLLSLWISTFGQKMSPSLFFDAVSVPLHGFEHSENLLLIGKDRIIYDTQIVHGEETIGEMTLFFYTLFDTSHGIWSYLKRNKLKIVYIENISLREQSSGYASSLFKYYENLFQRIGFNQFRLKASLSVGRYYWAKEGFDCLENSELQQKKMNLRKLVQSMDLPVADREVNRLNHVYDFANFRRDIEISVYRNAEGYYSITGDENHKDEMKFHLGKAFLLQSEPWDGFKVIYTNTPRRTGLIYSYEFLSHVTRHGHPESPKRISRAFRMIKKNEVYRSLIRLDPYVPDRELLEKVHDTGYLDDFSTAVLSGNKIFQTRDCSISEKSYYTSLLAVGGVMAGVDAVLNRRVENAFCVVRPPGHHAGKDYAMGFCFLNNIALGAIYARDVYKVEKIFILDWDVHHGNGTQDIFYEDPLTYFCSIHEHPTFCYPGTGRKLDRGKGKGQGFTLNVPLKPHASDAEVIEAFDREVVPEAERFKPDLILISAGFDAHKDDPIADLEFTEYAYEHMTSRLCDLADMYCEGRIVSVLEGGYNSSSLTSSILTHLETLQGRRQ